MRIRILIAFLLLIVLLLHGCSSYRTDITREEIVAAYEAAGYSVWTDTYDEKLDHGEIAYVQANHPDGDYIYFSIFETNEEAEAYKSEFYHPVMMGLFAVIFGDPSWPHWEVYGCIVAQYDDPAFFEVFEELTKAK